MTVFTLLPFAALCLLGEQRRRPSLPALPCSLPAVLPAMHAWPLPPPLQQASTQVQQRPVLLPGLLLPQLPMSSCPLPCLCCRPAARTPRQLGSGRLGHRGVAALPQRHVLVSAGCRYGRRHSQLTAAASSLPQLQRMLLAARAAEAATCRWLALRPLLPLPHCARWPPLCLRVCAGT